MGGKAFLFDGYAFCYRAYYAIRHLSNSKGEPTNAVYGFLTMLKKILDEEKPEYCAVCFDTKEKTFRHEQYEEYKAHRKPMPDDLAQQIPRIKDLINAYNLKTFEMPGYEADDVLGTLATKLNNEGLDVYIVTSDKDALQLVKDGISIYSPYRDKVTIYDEKKVKERYKGLGPASVIDIMAIMGDSSDNIPGIPGIGEKGAIELVNQFGSLERVIANVDNIKSASKQKKIRENIDLARLSRELVTINCSLNLNIVLDDLRVREPRNEKLLELFKELEFKAFLKNVTVAAQPKANPLRAYSCLKDEKSFENMLLELSKVSAFAIDTETTDARAHQAKLVGISLSYADGKAFYIALKYPAIQTKEGIDKDYALKKLKPFLENEKIKKYGQNIKYDAIVLARCDIKLAGIAFDTMVASYLINPVKLNQNLDDISLEYLGLRKITYADVVGAGKDRKTIDCIDVDLVSEYACEDADCVWQLVPLLRKELDARQLWKLFEEIEMPLVSVLWRMEMNGVTIDADFLKNLSDKCEKELIKLQRKIYKEAKEEFNINSPKQLSVILFDKLKLPVIKKTKTGYSTNVTVLEELAYQHELPKHILRYRELTKLKSTYLDALPQLINPETGMVHTSFNQTITATGRLSSSEPNMQNIPIKTELGREVRRAFIPRGKERKILAVDYSQIELRLLAHFSKDKRLMSAFEKETDVHTYTATLLYDVADKDVTSEMRHLAKIVNFSIIYGKTAYGLSRDLGISVKEAQKFIDAYFARYKKIASYLESLKEEARTCGYVKTILGRRALIPDILSKNANVRQFAERAAMNAPLQGSAADLIKKAMIEIDALLRKKKLDAYMILQVHDELVFDVSNQDVDALRKCVVQTMENALRLTVPLKVDVTVGDSWYEY